MFVEPPLALPVSAKIILPSQGLFVFLRQDERICWISSKTITEFCGMAKIDKKEYRLALLLMGALIKTEGMSNAPNVCDSI